MIIKKLELQGFKSFPERTKIVFHTGITAIVGPNGTGKSNIVDAILWVLGGQRQKGLRGEKTEDIIFNGNTKKPPLGMADVALSLEHQEEEIVISHRVFRSGESEYRLNGKTARLKDIQDTLWKRAVAEKEYFVIEQGSVGSLITSKPAEKRALLEEAAGTAFYKDKKKEAQSKLASSEQNLIRLDDIISEVGRSKNSLQRQAQAAVRYRKLREKTRELAGFNYRRKLSRLEHRHEEALRRHTDGLTQEKDLASRIKTEEKELADRRREIWELEKSIKDDQDALYAIETQLNHAEADKDREAKRIESLAERQRKAAAAAAELEQELADLEADVARRRNSMADLDRMLKDKQAEVDRAAADNLSVQDSVLLREKSIEALKNQHLEKLAALTELKNESVKVEKELELIARQDAKLNAQLEQEKTVLQAKEEAVRSVESDLSEALRAKAAKDALIEDLRGSLEERQFAIERLRTWIEETRRTRDEDSFKLQALQKMEESRRAIAGPADIPEALGRLADLIETDPEYAAMVDAIWKEEAAVPVIPALDFLKRAAEGEQDGRFLLVAPRSDERPSPPALQDPGVLGFLKSRLRPSPKIKDYLGQLREGVIVRDMKSAVELWLRHPSLNFVTAKGDLLLSSGLLKLGHSEDGIFALGQEIKKLEERTSRRDEELAPLVAELEKKSREKDHLEEDSRRESSLLEELGARIHELEKMKISEQAEREKTAGAVTLFTQEVEILRRDAETLGLNRDDLVRRIVALEEEERAWKARIETEESDAVMHRGKNIQEEKRFIELRADTALLNERSHHMTGQVQELSERIEAVQKKILAFREESQRAGKEEEEARGAASNLMTKASNLEEEKKAKQSELTQKEADLLKKHAAGEEQDRRIAGLREELEKRKEERVKWEVAKAEVDRDLVNLEETCWQELKKTLHEVKNERPEIELSDAEIEEQLAKADEDLQRIKSVNLMAEEEYLSHKERYDFLIQQRDDLRQSIDATQEAIRTIDEESQTQFLTALAEVNKNFQEVFTLLFKGGSAEVKLLDDAFPQDSGVEIIAQPPGKKVQNIALLSGGEKSLTSLAFLFALFRFKPTPFCILDEVDAALDDVNLARFLDLMRNIKSATQFIIITHNYKTMEVADYIYGTTMAEPNITKLYSVRLEKQQELIS